MDRKVDGGPEEHTLTSGGTVSETPKLINYTYTPCVSIDSKVRAD